MAHPRVQWRIGVAKLHRKFSAHTHKIGQPRPPSGKPDIEANIAEWPSATGGRTIGPTCCSVVDVTGATLPHPGCAAVVPNRLWDYML